MNVHIHKPRKNGQPFQVDPLAFDRRSDLFDTAVLYENIDLFNAVLKYGFRIPE